MTDFWNGSGGGSRTNGTDSGATTWADNEARDNRILAALHDAHDEALWNSVKKCQTLNGETTPTANLPMGNFMHTGVGAATARNNYAQVAQIQDAGYIYAAAGGSANAQTLTVAPAIAAYANGQTFIFKAKATNTADATLAVSGLAAIHFASTISGALLVSGEIQINNIYEAVYKDSYFWLVNPSSVWTSYTVTPAGGTGGAHTAKYCLSGKRCTVWMDSSFTSNATSYTLSAPFTAAASSISNAPAQVADVGLTLAPPGMAVILGGESAFTLYSTFGQAAFTNHDLKSARFVITYEVA